MFTKQHYEVLARLIRCNDNLERFTEDLICTLKHDNPNFNESVFRRAMKR